MTLLLRTIRMLVAVLLVEKTCCQNGFYAHNMVEYQQMHSNDRQTETITNYSTNIIPRDPSRQSLSSVYSQYRDTDDSNKNIDYNKENRERSKKIYRIKNPFHHNLEDTENKEGSSDLHDSDTAASNQYAAIRYSLPPEEFLQQMRAQNQYNQQQQQILSTLAPNIGYTATPLPQYQLSTIPISTYDTNNQQSNHFQLDPKISQAQTYLSNSNYRFGPIHTFGLDVVQSTPSPVYSYLSTPFPHQYLSTSAYPYVSSSSPFFSTSPANLQSYVSSPLTSIQAYSPDNNKHITSTIVSSSHNVDDSDSNKNIQKDHYDNLDNGVKYSVSTPHQQQQNNYPFSTSMPLSSSYSDTMRDNGQNALNVGVNTLSKSLQDLSSNQFQNFPHRSNQQESRTDSNAMNINSETHRMGSLPSVNNVYLSYFQPDYKVLNTMKSQSKDLQQNSNQQDTYSNGDYGWKLNNKIPLSNTNSYSTGNYPRYLSSTSQSSNGAVSQMNFHMDTGKSYNSEPYSGLNSENALTQTTMKPHEKLKQQQQFHNNNYQSNFIANNQQAQNIDGNAFYANNETNKNKYPDGSNPTIYSFSSPPSELITVNPYYYGNNKDIHLDNKPKPSFDHDKALQNIVPIDVSNVVPNSVSQSKSFTKLDNNNNHNLGKEYLDQNLKQYYRTLTDSSYKDKNTLYGFNLKTKPEDFLTLDYLRPIELNAKQQQYNDHSYKPNSFVSTSHTFSYTPQGSSIYQDNIQSPTNFQQQELPYIQNQIPSDIATILKLNDAPNRLTQGVYSENLRLHNSNFDQSSVPSPLPTRLNQDLDSHQLDVTSNILNKLILDKQPGGNFNRPELDTISTINGFKVANPFNVDLRLVAEMLKGKPINDETRMFILKDQFSKQSPLQLDLSQLQLLLRNENSGNLESFSESLSGYNNPYINIYSSKQYPYQSGKYSRSQEEEESIMPISETSNTHPIGAVIEQVDVESETDITAPVDENDGINFDDDGTKKSKSLGNNGIGNRYRHPNTLLSGRHMNRNKYTVEEPYPLLKPPPLQSTRHRGNRLKGDTHSRRRRRMNRPKVFKILKSEPLYEDESNIDHIEPTLPILLRPPPLNAESKSDKEEAS